MWAHDTKGTSCRGLGKSLQDLNDVCGRCRIGWRCSVTYCGNRLSSPSLHPQAQRLSQGSGRLESLRVEHSQWYECCVAPPSAQGTKILVQTFLWNLTSQASFVCISQQLPSSKLPQNSLPSFGGPVAFLAQSSKALLQFSPKHDQVCHSNTPTTLVPTCLSLGFLLLC